jgi:hypothetical protein
MFKMFNWLRKKKEIKPEEPSASGKLRSGVYIRVHKRSVDVLDLTDEQFVSLLSNELNAFQGKRRVTPELKKRVLENYLKMVRVNPESCDKVRISALLALQSMGRHFSCVHEEWDECIKKLGLEGNQE